MQSFSESLLSIPNEILFIVGDYVAGTENRDFFMFHMNHEEKWVNRCVCCDLRPGFFNFDNVVGYTIAEIIISDTKVLTLFKCRECLGGFPVCPQDKAGNSCRRAVMRDIKNLYNPLN